MTTTVYFKYGDDDASFEMDAAPRVGETLEADLGYDKDRDGYLAAEWICQHPRWRVDSVHHCLRFNTHFITCYLSKS